MQQPPTAVAQLQINAVESLDTSGTDKQFVVVNTAISTQNNMNIAPIEGILSVFTLFHVVFLRGVIISLLFASRLLGVCSLIHF